MSEEKNMEQTEVKKNVEVNLDEIFNGAPGADSITLPEENSSKKPSMFSRPENVDLSFVDEPKKEVKEEVAETTDTEEVKEPETPKTPVVAEGGDTPSVEKKVTKDEIDDILNDGLELAESEDEKSTAKGRKRIEGMSDVFKKMIENEEIIPFDDDKELDDYSAKDWKELIKANMDERANKVRRETPKQFFDSLPSELQTAAKYVADGGQDLKGLFSALASVEETRELDLNSEQGQAHIIREYLSATGYGSAEDIQEEIEIWKDLGKLKKQASKFKPKLDKMSEAVVARKNKK